MTVHEIGSHLSVSLDLEVDGSLALGIAHDIASELEDAVREEIGPSVEVETHIEPLQPYGQSGLDAPPERIAAVRDALNEITAGIASVGMSSRRPPTLFTRMSIGECSVSAAAQSCSAPSGVLTSACTASTRRPVERSSARV